MEEQIRSKRRLRKLNLSAPILSTRRAGTSATTTTATTIPSWSTDQNSHLDWRQSFQDTSTSRIPFSWEQVPGTPKGFARETAANSNITPPRPALPPGRWHLRNIVNARGDKDDDDDDNDDDTGSYEKGSITGDNDHRDVFSDAIDAFSLSEPLDVESNLSDDHVGIFKSRVNRSPNFIIRRFLPDANALAFYGTPSHIVSSKKLIEQKHPIPPNNCHKKVNPHQMVNSQGQEHCVLSRVAGTGQAFSPPKACGIGLWLPWRTKHMPCGLKSPVRQGLQSAKGDRNARQSHSSCGLQQRPSCMRSTVEDARAKCNNKG